jgi:hypothetical protein
LNSFAYRTLASASLGDIAGGTPRREFFKLDLDPNDSMALRDEMGFCCSRSRGPSRIRLVQTRGIGE